ncbi:hypothetical protein KKB84_01440 [bacterium]|nr:hypothetical protein [bacterium]
MLIMLKKYQKEILIFLVIFVSYTYFFHLAPHANSLTRYNLVQAIVYEGRLTIDSYHQNTVDKSLYQGHYYSDKAIGTSLFALLPCWLIKISGLKVGINFIYYLLRVITVSLPSALFAVIFYRFLGLFNHSSKYNVWLTFALSLGTLCFPYSTLFYGHQQAAILCFISFILIYLLKDNLIPSSLGTILVGFFSGLALITEYTSAIIIMLLFIYLIITLPEKKKLWLYFLFALPSLILLLIYNYLCFENPFVLGYANQAPEIAAEAMGRGFFGFSLPKLSILYTILFSSYRGVFYTSPVLLFSILGFYYLYKERHLRMEFYICLISTITLFLLNSSFAAWHGGYGIGPRYVIPMLPFMAFPIIFIFNKNKHYFKLFLLLTCLSIFLMFITVMIDPEVPQFFEHPIRDYILPQIFNNHLDYNIGFFLFSKSNLVSILSLFTIISILSILIYKHSAVRCQLCQPGQENKREQ